MFKDVQKYPVRDGLLEDLRPAKHKIALRLDDVGHSYLNLVP